jgi:membrane protein
VVLWLLISYGFRIYVTRYSSFNVTYGALGSFMVLMVWLYLSSATILLGGIINGALVNVDLEANAKAQ